VPQGRCDGVCAGGGEGPRLIDGGSWSTTNLDIAVEAAPSWVVVINPIVPVRERFRRARCGRLRGTRRDGSRTWALRDGYQAFKLLAHQRLHEMAKGWEGRYPGVDIVLIEPEAGG